MNFLFSLLSTTLVITPIILILIALTPLIDKKFSANGRCWMWLLVTLSLCAPFVSFIHLPAYQINVPVTAFNDSYQNAVPDPAEITTLEDTAADDAVPAKTSPISFPALSLTDVLLGLWLIGCAVSAVYHAYAHTKFMRFIKRWGEPYADAEIVAVLNHERINAGIETKITPINCKGIRDPMLVGYFRPKILLPYTCLETKDMALILRHELAHYKRHDLWFKLALVAARCVYWFNPAVHLMAAQANKDIEMACDARTINGMDVSLRKHYSEMLLSMAAGRSVCHSQLTTNFRGGKNMLKQRLTNIFSGTKKKGTAVFAVVGAIVLAGGLMVGFDFSAKTAEAGGLNTAIPASALVPLSVSASVASNNNQMSMSYTDSNSFERTTSYYSDGYIFILKLKHSESKITNVYTKSATLEYAGNQYVLGYSDETLSFYGDQTLLNAAFTAMKKVIDGQKLNSGDNNMFELVQADGPTTESPDNLLAKYFDAGNNALLYAITPYASVEKVDAYAENAYENSDTGKCSILLSNISQQKADELFIKALKDKNIPFISILLNKYSGSVDAAADSAYQNATPSTTGMLSVLLPKVSQQKVDELFTKALNDKNIPFISILLDRYSGSVDVAADSAYQRSSVGMLYVLLPRVSQQKIDELFNKAVADKKGAFVSVLLDYYSGGATK